MLGYLIYEKEEAKKNAAFIRIFEEEGIKRNITFRFVPLDKITETPMPDFVLNRTRKVSVSCYYEQRGVIVFHDKQITEIGNHKYRTLQYFKRYLPAEITKGDWAPDSLPVSAQKLSESMKSNNWRADMTEYWKSCFPESVKKELWNKDWVLKTVDGHGGNEVLLLENGLTQEQLLKRVKRFLGKDCILQERISADSKDVRVYIVGGQIYEAMLRQGTKDFRSNFSLGGTASVYPLSEDEKDYIRLFVQCFSKDALGMAGIDFIVRKDGKLIFNELEEMVGSRMLYQYTKKNIVRDYVIWLSKVLQ